MTVVCGRTIGGCWISELVGPRHNSPNSPLTLWCCCGWNTRIPQGAERYLTEALAEWREHATRKVATA